MHALHRSANECYRMATSLSELDDGSIEKSNV